MNSAASIHTEKQGVPADRRNALFLYFEIAQPLTGSSCTGRIDSTI